MNNKGFSLVELIIVIAIMAVLMGVLAPQLLKYVEESRQQTDLSAMAEIENAVKIAVANEDVYNNLEETTTVDFTDGTTFTGDEGTLLGELALTVPDEIDFTSKLYDGTTQTVTVTIDTTNGTVTVTNSWDTEE